MADYGLFIGFHFPARGREQAAATVFNDMLQFLGGQTRTGAVESLEPVFLQPHGGDLGGFILVRGDRARLDALVASEEFQRLSLRAQLTVEGFGVVPCTMGEEIQRSMGIFLEVVRGLG